MKVGIRVKCAVCGHSKQPRGRSAPMGLLLCHWSNCKGYDQEPLPGELWPGETEENSDFLLVK